MTKRRKVRRAAALAMLTLAGAGAGCVVHVNGPRSFMQPPGGPGPLGTLTDPIWQTQEDNAEAAKFYMHEHEFVKNDIRLNWAGEDHIKQIAARLVSGQNFPVIVERSTTSAREDTEYEYPIHPNPELDMRRRDLVVQALLAMGVADANQRVSIGTIINRPYSDQEAERAYYRSMYNFNYFGGGFGGGFGGFGGGGFGGGFF